MAIPVPGGRWWHSTVPRTSEAAFLDGPPHLVAVELMGGVSALLGYPVDLSSRIEVDDEVAYYVTPEGGA